MPIAPLLLAAAVVFAPAPSAAPLAPVAKAVRERVDSLVTWSLAGNVTRSGVRYERTVRRVTEAGASRLRAEAVWHDTSGAVVSRTVSEADAGTLAPHAVRVRAAGDSASLLCAEGRLVGWAAPARGALRTFDEPLPAGAIGPEFEDAAVASLPLRPGLTGTLDVLGAFGGVQRRVVTVLGPDTLDAAGKVRDCWVVQLASGGAADARVTLWVDRTTRRVWQRRGDYGNFSWWHRVTNP